MRKENRIKLKAVLILVIGILLFSSLVSGASLFNYQSNQYIQTNGEEVFDREMCESGRDFIIQITPLGCTPAVVRSDLLEEQDVSVYCQLSAIKLNPLADIESVSRISFSGNNSRYISGISFYPARAALGLSEGTNSPFLGNIGYVAITLKKQKNESSMPDFVSGNLTAKIQYDVKSFFGSGRTAISLRELSEEEWESGYSRYGFWNKKGYLRAEYIGSNDATISVYNTDLRKISSLTLGEGETSQEISIQGFDYCDGGLQLKLEELEFPATKARLKINEDVVEVSEGEKFLDNKCGIKKIESRGLSEKVVINCREDDKPRVFPLSIEPKIKLKIGEQEGEFSAGDFLYKDSKDPKKSVYLAYIGTKGTDESLSSLFVYLVSLPGEALRLTDEELSYVSDLSESLVANGYAGSEIIDSASKIVKSIFSSAERAGRFFAKGESYQRIDYSDNKGSRVVKDAFGKSIEISDFGEFADADLDEETLEYYLKAVGDYDKILDSYSEEEYNSLILGEEALYGKIILSKNLEQKKVMADLCGEFRRKFPDSKKEISFCENNYRLSNSEISYRSISINGKNVEISFEGIYEPSPKEFSATVRGTSQNGESFEKVLLKNDVVYINREGDYMQLLSLNQDSAEIRIKTGKSIATKKLEKNSQYPLGEYVFTLREINLKKLAKVSVVPRDAKGSEANFNFRIEIEKRLNLTLAPDMIQKKIDSLNKTIGTIEDISGFLNTSVTALQSACKYTGAILTAKNFIENLKGKGIARQYVMRGKNGWYEKCTDLVSSGKFSSLEKCFLNNSDEIDKDVADYSAIIKKRNEDIKQIESETLVAGKKFLEENVVNTDEFVKIYSEQVKSSVSELSEIQEPETGKTISISEIKELLSYEIGWKSGFYDLDDLKEIGFYAERLRLNPDDKTAETRLYSLFSDLKTASKDSLEKAKIAEELNIEPEDIVSLETEKNVRQLIYTGLKNSELKNPVSGTGIDGETSVAIVRLLPEGRKYILALDDSKTKDLTVKRAGNNMMVYTFEATPVQQSEIPPELKNIYFRKYDANSYTNKYISSSGDTKPLLRYYETEPYKGMPAIVPFDLDNGWYAAMKQVLPVGNNVKTYDASGQVNSFYLCNVGENGIEEFYSGIGDDDCEGINRGTGQLYNQFPGITNKDEVARLINKAEQAIMESERKYSQGVKEVVINGKSIKVGTPAFDIPDIQCQDLMSPKECQLLFNVCDPVICPSSRCNFGGVYPVKDVIQSGVIGSTLLCLPNWVAFGGDVYIPVCLTGIKAGIDGWISVLNSYRDCLQSNLNSGETIGICDETRSIYLCEFFWRQAEPLINIAIPKIIEKVFGNNVRGGGEYLSVANAFEGAKKSADYFTQYYGKNIFESFKAEDTSETGTSICRNFVSAVVPQGAEIINSMSQPASPPQFHGRFDEIPFTDVTVPPTSHYKVFYHIFAGKNSGAYYSVYLKSSPGSSFYQDTSSQRAVDSGYVSAGSYVSNTEDFTAPSGYKELCINVNGQEECGFKEVSTSFAIEYIRDAYVSGEASRTDIKTEEECISDYTRGILRICATGNPGTGTDAYADGENSKWIDVGHCGNEKLRCWLDTDSVKKVIESPDLVEFVKKGDIRNLSDTTLEKVTGDYLEVLRSKGDYSTTEEFESEIKVIEEEEDNEKKAGIITEFFEKVFYNYQKAYLLLSRGNAYGNLALLFNTKRADAAVGEGTGMSVEELCRIAVADSGNLNECIEKCRDAEDIITCAETYSKTQAVPEKPVVSQETGELETEPDVEILSPEKPLAAGIKKGQRSNEFIVPKEVMDLATSILYNVPEERKFLGLYITQELFVKETGKDVKVVSTGEKIQDFVDIFDLLGSRKNDFVRALKDKGFSDKDAEEYYKLFTTGKTIILVEDYSGSTLFHERVHEIIDTRLDSTSMRILESARDDIFSAIHNWASFFSVNLKKYLTENSWEELYTYMAENQKYPKALGLNDPFFIDPLFYGDRGRFKNNYPEAYGIYSMVFELAQNPDINKKIERNTDELFLSFKFKRVGFKEDVGYQFGSQNKWYWAFGRTLWTGVDLDINADRVKITDSEVLRLKKSLSSVQTSYPNGIKILTGYILNKKSIFNPALSTFYADFFSDGTFAVSLKSSRDNLYLRNTGKWEGKIAGILPVFVRWKTLEEIKAEISNGNYANSAEYLKLINKLQGETGKDFYKSASYIFGIGNNFNMDNTDYPVSETKVNTYTGTSKEQSQSAGVGSVPSVSATIQEGTILEMIGGDNVRKQYRYREGSWKDYRTWGNARNDWGEWKIGVVNPSVGNQAYITEAYKSYSIEPEIGTEGEREEESTGIVYGTIPLEGRTCESTLQAGIQLSVKYAGCVSATQIDTILENADSPAEGTGDAFVNLGKKYDIDPSIPLAFFKMESSYGKLGIASNTKSVGNVKYSSNCPGRLYTDAFNRRWCKYDSWEQSIEAWYKLISGTHYAKAGRTTVEEIIPVYAPQIENDVLNYIKVVRYAVSIWSSGNTGYI